MRHLWTRHRGPLLGLLSLVVPWFIFVRLAREVWEGEGLPGDRFLREFLHAHHGPVQDKAAFWLARLGGPMGATVLATAVALGVWWALHRRAAAFFGLAVVGAEILNLAAKYFVPRSRPLPWMDLDPQTAYSFPSGHSMAAAALGAALAFLLWPTRWRWAGLVLGLGWALGMGWSRVYLGVHYPSDVLAGWVGSVGWVSGLHLLFQRQLRALRAAFTG